MAIRVLRVIEYVYETADRAARDMQGWTHSRRTHDVVMRSSVMPIEVIEWTEPDPTQKPDADGQ